MSLGYSIGPSLGHSLEDYVDEENPVRVIEVFIDEMDLAGLGFSGMTPAATGRPAYHPSTLLKIYLYGYLNRVQSSRRLEREAQRNIELMWLTGRLAPDFKTIADFRKDNGAAIRAVCRQFVELCRQLGLFTRAVVAIDGSKFKAVNSAQNPAALRLPEDMLFAWAHAHPDVAPAFLAVVFPVLVNRDPQHGTNAFHPMTKRLIDEFGDREDVLRAITRNMHTFGWSGSSQEPYLAMYLEPFRGLANHPIGAVRRWAARSMAQLEKMMSAAREQEDEQNAVWE